MSKETAEQIVQSVIKAMIAAGEHAFYCDEDVVDGGTDYFARVATIATLEALSADTRPYSPEGANWLDALADSLREDDDA